MNTSYCDPGRWRLPSTFAAGLLSVIGVFLMGCPMSGDDLLDAVGNRVPPGSLSGKLTVGNFTIPAGSTMTVVGDVEIVASGNVTIDGTLVAEAGAAGGFNIIIRAKGDITVRGLIEAGAAGATAKPKAAQNMRPMNDPGRVGRTIVMVSFGNLTIAREAIVAATNGTDGVQGNLGGAGGKGGDVALCATKTLAVHGMIIVGNGGNGGDVTGSIENGVEQYSNSGGDAGVLYITGSTIDFPGFDAATYAVNQVVYDQSADAAVMIGGWGGHAGAVFLVSNQNACTTAVGSATGNVPLARNRAANGGRGWTFGGNGGLINLLGTCSWQGLNGANIEGVGGDGGDVLPPDPMNIGITAIGDVVVGPNGGFALPVVVVGATGGMGGGSAVQATNGRLSGNLLLAGGNGGAAISRGGRGGHGLFSASQKGGRGGGATAAGGGGGDGWHRTCDDPDGPGGDAGNGGKGEAYGGDGGDGVTPGQGGLANVLDFAPSSFGGMGGQGSPGGAGGAGAETRWKNGEPGAGPPTGESTIGLSQPTVISIINRDGDPGQAFSHSQDCSSWAN